MYMHIHDMEKSMLPLVVWPFSISPSHLNNPDAAPWFWTKVLPVKTKSKLMETVRNMPNMRVAMKNKR